MYRYANNPSLAAVELINEPPAPGVTFENLNKYYKAGYDTVRKHSSSAYVILSNRLNNSDAAEFPQLARGLKDSVIDVHYYNLYDTVFNNLTAQQNIDFIYSNRSVQLSEVTTIDGPLSFEGNGLENGKSMEHQCKTIRGLQKPNWKYMERPLLDAGTGLTGM
ncbi:uncharacterized protein LOC122073282 [Macadamia integrifolia]|uniref:uncharacterized protein LOC122073282 n=1 Tax=Macadamia integrifolia TaxID=60698 RepID=UPI001C4FF866|nr:uncharacterized protein LOC122073282 [Macadamia integrifolia]